MDSTGGEEGGQSDHIFDSLKRYYIELWKHEIKHDVLLSARTLSPLSL